MIKQGRSVSYSLIAGPTGNSFERKFRISSIRGLSFLLALILMAFMGCTHSMDNAEDSPTDASTGKTEVVIKQSWNGDYPVDQLTSLPEKDGSTGAGYIGNPQTFAKVWGVFKPGEPEPDVDFNENLVIFVRNTQYYNRTMIGKVVLEDGVAKVMAMETLSARQIEEVVALSMAVITRAGVNGIQVRDGVIEVAK
jgi:hypothetical protein